ncbi:MAG: bifunctional folylpolyglutamate synthase/dihydrofolate synthase [Mesorhizobium sp.]|nr:MAG: bifunctional folylpolyglutamate synthase/dihydrofolate synthase [Mesorhizobium sp.]
MTTLAADREIESLMALHPKGFDLSLDRITRLLERLGNPQELIPPAIHIAGTNGKGSCAAFSRALLEAAGHLVHVHTSPHLVNWHERYRLAAEGGGRLVDDQVFAEAIARVAAANEGQKITVFEILTAVTFLLLLIDTAERLDCPTFVYGQDFLAFEENGRMVYQDEDGLMDLPPPRLPGRHQFANAAAAIAAIKAAGFEISHRATEKAMGSVAWPGRMQKLTQGRLTELAPKGADIWLDGGHNPGAGLVIAEALAEQEEKHPRPLFLISGMINTKDQSGYFRAFKGLARHVYTVPVSLSDAGVPNDELALRAGEAGLSAEPVSSVASALMLLRDTWDGPPPRILIGGSLYLAGAVLAENGTPPT